MPHFPAWDIADPHRLIFDLTFSKRSKLHILNVVSLKVFLVSSKYSSWNVTSSASVKCQCLFALDFPCIFPFLWFIWSNPAMIAARGGSHGVMQWSSDPCDPAPSLRSPAVPRTQSRSDPGTVNISLETSCDINRELETTLNNQCCLVTWWVSCHHVYCNDHCNVSRAGDLHARGVSGVTGSCFDDCDTNDATCDTRV